MIAFERAARAYRTLAVYFMNTVLMGAVVFTGYYLIHRWRESSPVENPIERYGISELMPGYPGRTEGEVAAIMKETYGRPLIYEAYTHFRELPSPGQFVNVTEAGYRIIQDQAPWPPEKNRWNVFVFGGSTTWGAGVADLETIPSALQKELRKLISTNVCVYNFGRGFYYSSQEKILFSNLLAAGHLPDAVVFIDGLNDFYRTHDAPQFSSQFMALLNQSLYERNGTKDVKAKDLTRKNPTSVTGTPEERAAAMVQRYLRNKQTIQGMADAYHIKAFFVWQPIPSYHFDLTFHPFAQSPKFHEHLFPAKGYENMAFLRVTNAKAADIIWLADMQKDAREQLYVDAVHYTAKMCGQIAKEIARQMYSKLPPSEKGDK
jgi:hypothetical protein